MPTKKLLGIFLLLAACGDQSQIKSDLHHSSSQSKELDYKIEVYPEYIQVAPGARLQAEVRLVRRSESWGRIRCGIYETDLDFIWSETTGSSELKLESEANLLSIEIQGEGSWKIVVEHPDFPGQSAELQIDAREESFPRILPMQRDC